MRGLGALPESFAALVKSVSAIGRLSLEGDLWSGTVRALTRASPVFFCLTDFGMRCNEKEAKQEETNFVKRVVKIVRSPMVGEAVATCHAELDEGGSDYFWVATVVSGDSSSN